MSEYDDELREGVDDPEEDYVKKQFGLLLYRLQKLAPRSRARLQSDFTQKMIDSTLAVETPKGTLSFVLLGKTSGGRAMTVLTKQPATIEWIDSFQPGSVFWDIGASVGVFSVYAALATDTTIVAFEPAAVNYYLLSANCGEQAAGQGRLSACRSRQAALDCQTRGLAIPSRPLLQFPRQT